MPFGLVVGLFVFITLAAFKVTTPDTSLIWFIAIGSFSAIASNSFVVAFRPYCTFETRRAERRNRQFNWLVLGFLGFILFTVVGVYFRQKLLGF